MTEKTYDDIIDFDYKGSPTRARMPLSNRAKIFLPFAALRGHAELIEKKRQESEKQQEENKIEEA